LPLQERCSQLQLHTYFSRTFFNAAKYEKIVLSAPVPFEHGFFAEDGKQFSKASDCFL